MLNARARAGGWGGFFYARNAAFTRADTPRTNARTGGTWRHLRIFDGIRIFDDLPNTQSAVIEARFVD